MKKRLAILLLAGWLAPGLVALAQGAQAQPETPPAPAVAEPKPAEKAEPANTAAQPAPTESKEAKPATDSGEKILLISFEDPPLEIIKSLLEQAQLKGTLDERVQKGLDAAGKAITNWTEAVTVRWENTTARQALTDFLARYKLVLSHDAAKDQYLVTYAAPAKGAKAEAPPPGVSKPAEGEGGLVDIDIEDRTILDALDVIAGLAKLNYDLDAKLTAADAEGRTPVNLTNTVNVRWQRVDARHAFEFFLDSRGLQMTLDRDSGIAKITAKPLTEPRLIKTVPLRFAPNTNVAAFLTQTFTNVKVYSDPRISQLVVTATEKEFSEITNLLKGLDAPVRQILIAAQFWETTRNPKSVRGIDWSGTLQQQNIRFGNGLTAGQITTTTPGDTTTRTLPGGRTTSVTAPSKTTSVFDTTVNNVVSGLNTPPGVGLSTAGGFTPATAFLNADGVRAALSFLNTDADTESIATPRAVALDGQATELSVVRNVPIFEEQQGTQTQAGVQPNTVKPNYSLSSGGASGTVLNEVGIKLVVTPRVVGDTNVFLDLKPEISSVEPIPERKILGGRVNEAPVFTRRKVNTQAVVPSGTTLVLGGLVNDEKQKSYTKVPLLGDIPILGLAFRKDEKSRNKRNLIIFVTPTILLENHFTTDNQETEFLKSKRGALPEKEPSPWDSGKPYDWKGLDR